MIPISAQNGPLPTSSALARLLLACRLALPALLLAAALALAPAASATSRIKDIVDFEGVRDNMLIGYGLVVGLDGSGDTLQNSPFTEQSLIGMLERLGVTVRDANLRAKNVAAVVVTATLPPFSRQGSRIDVAVSALGDATSLLGGTLLVTPLLGADGEVYAVGQGPVAVGGFSVEGNAEEVTQGVPTSGAIANGAIVEREVPFDLAGLHLAGMSAIRLALRNPDFTTARRVAEAINAFIGSPTARATDPGTVAVWVPDAYGSDIVTFLADIEQLAVDPDTVARVVINEDTGIIVMGEDVRISTVAIAQGNLTIRITETPQVSQPQPFSNTGRTQVVPRTDIQVDQGEDNRLAVLASGVTLQELVSGLNGLGIGPRDMIAILQAIKAAGALQAEIEVR
jgi:flagellar P-ring protein precursor FlgI